MYIHKYPLFTGHHNAPPALPPSQSFMDNKPKAAWNDPPNVSGKSKVSIEL